MSYASQDKEAAKRICDALRAAGVEVWLDQSELVGGDAWDHKIRQQIKECALLIPVISAATQARTEGYFRLEWRLADQRTHLMAKGRAFLLPVVIDDTRDADAQVPDSFTEVQWTRLPAGETSPAFCARIQKLLSGEPPATGSRPSVAIGESRVPPVQSPRWIRPILASAVIVIAVLAVTLKQKFDEESKVATKPPVAVPPGAGVSPVQEPATPPAPTEARLLVAKARKIFESLDATRDDIRLAEEFLTQATNKDSTDAEVWAAMAQLDNHYMIRGWDVSDKRREDARIAGQRARRLDPQSFEARFTWYPLPGTSTRELEEGERTLRALREEHPNDHRVLRALANTLQTLGRRDEANVIRDESARLPGGDPLALYDKARYLWINDRPVEAEDALQASLRQQPFSSALLLSLWITMDLHGDLDRAKAILEQIAPAALLEDRGCYYSFMLHYLRRDADAALAALRAVPRDWILDNWYRGPKGTLAGDALRMAGRTEAAALEWRAALKLVDARLASTPSDLSVLYNRAVLLGRLGEREEGNRAFDLVGQMAVDWRIFGVSRADYAATLVSLGRRADALQTIAREIGSARQIALFPAADLRLNPCWDSLRGDPEFVRLIAVAEAKERGAGKQSPVANVDEKSVAVLAFANLSDDKSNEYFSDGISEELLNVLAKIPRLKVTARASSFHFKGKDTPVPEIARLLGVAYVIEGSVRKQGDKVRITAQLIKAADDFHVWSDTFTRDLKDIFAVQEEIAGLIAKNLELKIGTVSAAALREVNPEAHRLVLEGRYFWNKRSAEEFERAEAAFRQAIALDPEFAPAHAGLAAVLATKISYRLYAANEAFSTEPIRQEALRALELDPQLAEAYPALGLAFDLEGRFEEEKKQYRRALELNPNYALPHHWGSLVLEHEGKLDEALVEIQKAVQLDPLSRIALITQARMLMHAGRWDLAMEVIKRVREMAPERPATPGNGAMCLLQLGRVAEAVEAARQMAALPATELRAVGDAEAIYVLRRTGHEAEAEAQAKQVLSLFAANSFLRGGVLAALGRWDEAVPYLEQTPGVMRYFFYWNPVWDEWRDDPRFKQLIGKLGRESEYATARETLARLRAEVAR